MKPAPYAKSAFFICTTPRSGSTLLCDLLAATGLAGRPQSYFRQASLTDWAEKFELAPSVALELRPEYFARAVGAGSGEIAAAPFGNRVMWNHMSTLLAGLRVQGFGDAKPSGAAGVGTDGDDLDVLNHAFGALKFVRLRRGDNLAQAVSHLKAEQSGLWHREVDGRVREQVGGFVSPFYDAEQISLFIREQADDEARWSDWFVRFGVTPLEVGYEALSADPATEIARILAHLGLADVVASAAVQSLEPRTAKLADEESAAWAARYRDEMGGD